MWKEMGYFNQPELFTKTEVPITLAVLVLIGSMILIRNNFRALIIAQIIVLAGFLLAGISTFLFINGQLSPVYWVTLVGMGLYMGYIPYNCVLFERLIATFRIPANVGFLIYIADSFGYLGSVGVVITKGVFNLNVQWVKFYSNSVIILSVIGVIGTLLSILYFSRKHKQLSSSHE